jgi:polyphenol oxidase
MQTDWLQPDWPAPVNVHALVTTRNGGVSLGPFASLNLGLAVGDALVHIEENRARLRTHLPDDPRWLKQVHGTDVVRVDQADIGAQADAAWTPRDRCVCAVQIADCLPVLLCDVSGTTVAAVHAGWRGLSAGVIENALASMNCSTQNVLAWLGPAIGPEHFEVGSDVYAAFTQHDSASTMAFRSIRPGKWLANLFMLATQRLRAAGVSNIFGGGVCTFEDHARFFSYRRDGVTGRMAAMIWMESRT